MTPYLSLPLSIRLILSKKFAQRRGVVALDALYLAACHA